MFTFSTSTSLNAFIFKCKSPSFTSCGCSTFQQLCAVANISGNQLWCFEAEVFSCYFYWGLLCSGQAWKEKIWQFVQYGAILKKKKKTQGERKDPLQECTIVSPLVCLPPSCYRGGHDSSSRIYWRQPGALNERRRSCLAGKIFPQVSCMHHQEKKRKTSQPSSSLQDVSVLFQKQTKKTQKAKLIALLKRTLSRRDVNKSIDCGLSFRSRIGGAMESSDKSSIQRLYLLVQLLHLSPPCPISRHALNTTGPLRSIMSHICAVQPRRPRLWRPPALIQRLASVPGGHSPGLAAPGGPVSPALGPQLSDSLVRIRTAAESENCVTFPELPGHRRERWPPIHFCEVPQLVCTPKMLLASGLLLHRTAPAVGSLPIKPLKLTWSASEHILQSESAKTQRIVTLFFVLWSMGKAIGAMGGFYTPTTTNPTTKDYQLENKLLFHTVMLQNIFGFSLSLSPFLHFPDKPFWTTQRYPQFRLTARQSNTTKLSAWAPTNQMIKFYLISTQFPARDRRRYIFFFLLCLTLQKQMVLDTAV